MDQLKATSDQRLALSWGQLLRVISQKGRFGAHRLREDLVEIFKGDDIASVKIFTGSYHIARFKLFVFKYRRLRLYSNLKCKCNIYK